MNKIVSLLLSVVLTSSVFAHQVTTVFGLLNVQEPVLLELMHSQAMQRIKEVKHTGIGYFVHDSYDLTRYDHCIGVWHICAMFGASVQEQAAAMLHDASHTAFSHVGDMIFDHKGIDSYQDEIHENYIARTDAYQILKNYGMTDVICDQAKHTFRILEQDLPDLCADRIEYNLHVGLLEGLLTNDDVHRILAHINYKDGIWYFDDVDAAYQFSMTSVALTRDMWGSAWNGFINYCCAQAIKRAMALGIISYEDIHFGVDLDLWQRLISSSDAIIIEHITRCKHYEHMHRLVSADDSYDYHYKPKCRAVNPLIKVDADLKRLTDVRDDYAAIYKQLQDACRAGYYIRFTTAEQKDS